MRWAVYTLSDATGVRYVGVSKNPDDRFKRHLREATAGKTHRHCWIMSLSDPPVMAVVEWVEDWDAAERKWIAHYRAQGCQLVNGNGGGMDMRQARKGATYPNVKRAWRVIEGSLRAVRRFGKPEQIAAAEAKIELFRASVAQMRRDGSLHIAEEFYARKFT